MKQSDDFASYQEWSTLLQATHHMRETLDVILEQLDLGHPSASSWSSLYVPPKVDLRGSNLLVNNVPVPLASRPLTLKLLQVFFQHPEHVADKLAITQSVYQQTPVTSIRRTQSNECNLNKLISRTRTFLELALVHLPWAARLEWLVYDHKERHWHLVMLKSQT
jgi:hypothetical protein